VNPSVRVALGVTLIVLGAVSGVAIHRLTRPGATIRPAPRAAAPPGAQSDAQPRVIPADIPDLAFKDLQGGARRLSDLKGHPLIVNFWATWCQPCRREIPLLIRLRHERAAEGLAIVGIAVDFRAPVLKYVKENGIDYPVLDGEDGGLAAVNAFGMQLLFPFSVFADREGRVVAVKVGELHQNEADFILDRIGDLDRGALDFPAAREAIAARLRDFAVERAKHP
jgi:thiol-disulfide isomerase/thioredoxin